MNDAERFWSKVDTSGECWTWLAGCRGGGYGSFYLNGRNRPAHRVSYEWERGPIPEGLVIDHVCRNVKCVRPSHLRAVTQRINVLSGLTLPAKCASRDRCPRGHMYSGDNLVITKQGHRACRTCLRANWRRHEDRRLALRRAARGEGSE